jgi:PAS domain S-box-containing protein
MSPHGDSSEKLYIDWPLPASRARGTLHFRRINRFLCALFPLRQRLNAGFCSRVALLFAVSQFFSLGLAAQVKPVRRVLIINEWGRTYAAISVMDDQIQTALRGASYQVELYSESLDDALFPDDESQREIREWIIHKYQAVKPDLIIAVGQAPLQFLASSRDRFLPGTPVVFCGSSQDLAGYPRLDSSFTGVWAVVQPEKTLDTALRLLPETRHVIVAGATGPYDRLVESTARERFKRYEDRLDFTYLTDLPMATLLERLRHLPNHSIIYLAPMMQDSSGTRFVYASDVVPMIVSAANAPVFVVADVAVGTGAVGGDVESFANQGRIAASVATKVLNGQSPASIPAVTDPGTYEFDWRALAHWGLKESDLPAGSVIINRPISIWRAYKGYILAAILLLLVQAQIIAALLLQRARRKKDVAELALSNERLRLAMESGKSVGWEWDLNSGRDTLFGDLRTMFGIPSERFSGTVADFYRCVHPDDMEAVADAMNDAKKNHTPYNQDFRVVRSDGSIRWVESRGKFDYANGKPIRMVGLAFDVTERKHAEEALTRSEEKFSKAFRESPLIITLTRVTDSCYIDVNDTYEKVTGWSREEVIGKTPFDFGLWVHPSERSRFVERLLAEGTVRNWEHQFRTRNGEIRIGVGSGELVEIQGETCALSVFADITDAKHAEEERQISERRFTQFFQTLPESCYLVGLDGAILGANLAATDALGYRKEELIGKHLSSIYAPESHSRFIDLLKKWRATGSLQNEEIAILTKSGERRTVLLTAGSILDTNGKPLYFTCTHLDITGRKEIEKLLQENQARLASIVESAMDAIIAIDHDQRILVFNAAAERMLGCRASKAIGTPIGRFIPQRFRNEQEERIRRLTVSGTAGLAGGGLGSAWALRATGEEFPIEASISQFEVNGRKVLTIIIRDITERRQAEEARNRHSAIVESSSDAIISMDHEGIIRSWNRGAQQMYDYSPIEAIGQPVNIIVPQHLRAEASELLQRTLAGDSISNFESVRVSKDGRPIEVSMTLSPVKDADGKIVGASKIERDITTRNQILAALQEGEERFRLAMSNVAAGLCILDLQGFITYLNPAAEKMLGWNHADLLGKKLHETVHYLHPDGSPFPASECTTLQLAKQGAELQEQQDTFIRKGGSFFPVIYSVSPLRKDGQMIGIVVGLRDDTQRRDAERAVRESEERFRLVANTAPVMIWMSGVDKGCNYFNRRWLEFTGRSVEEELGNGWADGLHPEDLKMCLAIYTQAFDLRESFQMEYRLRRHDGEYRWIFDQGVPRFDMDGSFAGYIGSAIDITERKSAEEVLSTVSQKLIEAQEEERTWLARELHDDINQRIALLSITLRRTMDTMLPASAVEARQQIEDSYNRAVSLGADVQALSHRLHSSKLDYLGLRSAAAGFCREFSQQHGVEIDFRSDDVPKNLPKEISLSMFRILQEALQNSAKHSGSKQYRETLESSPNEIRLSVEDSGVGFDPEAAGNGTGLGLTNMKERMKLVHGTLFVQSQVGKGTVIRASAALHTDAKSARAAT